MANFVPVLITGVLAGEAVQLEAVHQVLGPASLRKLAAGSAPPMRGRIHLQMGPPQDATGSGDSQPRAAASSADFLRPTSTMLIAVNR